MKSRVENSERSLLEWRKGYQIRLDEIKHLWKRRNGDYSRPRSRRDHASTRRRRTLTIHTKDKKELEAELETLKAHGSFDVKLENREVQSTIKEDEPEMTVMKDLETEMEDKIQKKSIVDEGRRVDWEVEDIRHLSEAGTKTLDKVEIQSENGEELAMREQKGEGICAYGNPAKLPPPEPPDLNAQVEEVESTSGHGKVVVTTVGGERDPPPQPLELDACIDVVGSLETTEVGPSSGLVELPPEPPNSCPCLAVVKTIFTKRGMEVLPSHNIIISMKMNGCVECEWSDFFSLMGQAQLVTDGKHAAQTHFVKVQF